MSHPVSDQGEEVWSRAIIYCRQLVGIDWNDIAIGVELMLGKLSVILDSVGC